MALNGHVPLAFVPSPAGRGIVRRLHQGPEFQDLRAQRPQAHGCGKGQQEEGRGSAGTGDAGDAGKGLRKCREKYRIHLILWLSSPILSPLDKQSCSEVCEEAEELVFSVLH